MSDRLQELEKLAELRDKGIITAAEFEKKKAEILTENPAPEAADERTPAWKRGTFVGYIFLSIFVPIAGFILGIVGIAKGGKRVKQGVSLLSLSILAFVAYGAIIASATGGDDELVQMVKGGTLSEHPGKTFGAAVEGFFGNPKWEHIVPEDGNDYVNVKGKVTLQNKEVEAALQYKVDKSNGSFKLQAFELNGVPQNMFMYAGLLEAMYK